MPENPAAGLTFKIQDLELQLQGEQKNNEKQKKAHLHFLLAYHYEQVPRLKRAILHYKAFIAICVTLDDSEGLIVGANRLSVCLFKKGRFP